MLGSAQSVRSESLIYRHTGFSNQLKLDVISTIYPITSSRETAAFSFSSNIALDQTMHLSSSVLEQLVQVRTRYISCSCSINHVS